MDVFNKKYILDESNNRIAQVSDIGDFYNRLHVQKCLKYGFQGTVTIQH